MTEREKLLNEAYSKIENSGFNCGVIIPTGVGKSFLLNRVLRELYDRGCRKILYVCDNQKLRDDDFPKEMIKWGNGDLLEVVERKCYQGVYKIRDGTYDLLLMDKLCPFSVNSGKPFRASITNL